MGDIALATNAKLSLAGKVADVQVRFGMYYYVTYVAFILRLRFPFEESMTYLMM